MVYIKKLLALYIILFCFSCKKSGVEEKPVIEEPTIPVLTTKLKLKNTLQFANVMEIWGVNPLVYELRSDNITSAISNGILLKGSDEKFRYLNVRSALDRVGLSGFMVPQATDYGDQLTKSTQANVSSVEFVFSGSEFEILMFGFGNQNAQGNIHIEVDGKFSNEDGYEAPSLSDGKKHYINVKFPAIVTDKRIRIVYSGLRLFGGIVSDASSVITKYTPKTDSKVVIIGDSYTAGVGAEYQFTKFFSYRLGNLLGFDNTIISGVGGTGYSNPNTKDKRKNFISRIDDVVLANPDAVIIAGGINDVGYGTPEELKAASLSYFKAIRVELPNTEIFIIGPWWGSGVDYPTTYSEAIKSSALLVTGTHFIDVKDWITGNGTIGAPNGSGNSDIYISADRVHPTVAGHKYLSGKSAEEIKKIIQNY